MKMRRDSFARRLTAEQREELFTSMAGGMPTKEAAKKVKEWSNPARPSAPSKTAVDKWFKRERVTRGIKMAAQAAVAAEANCPEDMDEKTIRLIGQKKFEMVVDGVEPLELASFERNEIAKLRLELDERKFEYAAWIAERNVILDRTRLILLRVRNGDKGEDVQKMVDLLLLQIDQMKNGGEAA